MYDPPRPTSWPYPRPKTLWGTWWWGIRNAGRWFVACAITNTLFLLSSVAIPLILGQAIDALEAGQTSHVMWWSVGLLAAAVGAAVSGAVQFHAMVMNWTHTAFPIMNAAAQHSCAVGAGLPRQKPAGEVLSVVNTDADRIGTMIDTQAKFIGTFLSMVVIIVLTLSQSWRMGVTVLIGVPATIGALSLITRALHSRQQASRTATGALTNTTADGINGLRILRGIGAERYFTTRYQQGNEQVRHTGTRLGQVTGVALGVEQLLPVVLLAVLAFQGYHEVLAGRLTTGQLVTFCGFAAVLVAPFKQLIMLVMATTRGMVALRHVRDLLALPTREETLGNTATSTSAVPQADLTDVTTGAVIPAGQATMVVCTDPTRIAALLYRLAQLDNPDGTVLVAEEKLDSWPVASIRQAIGLSDSEPQLTSGSLRRQVDPMQQHTDAACLAALEVACGQDVLDALPDGLADRVTEKGRSLSGGQRQRVALARAVLQNPATLLLVEPTSAVDAHTESAIGERLTTTRRGATTVIASTSPLLAHACDHIIVLTEDDVVAGPYDVMRHHPAFKDVVQRTIGQEPTQPGTGQSDGGRPGAGQPDGEQADVRRSGTQQNSTAPVSPGGDTEKAHCLPLSDPAHPGQPCPEPDQPVHAQSAHSADNIEDDAADGVDGSADLIDLHSPTDQKAPLR